MFSVKEIFSKITPEKIKKNQIDEAMRFHLEHAALAEHHSALAKMYTDRVQRLNDTNTSVVTEQLVA